MARKTPSRKELRKQVEAAEAIEKAGGKKKKAASKKTATTRSRRSKTKAAQRKRLLWAVFSGSMKEEARFPYDQREAAEDKIKQLKEKSPKKMYFIQPVKEVIADAPAAAAEDEE